MAKKKKNKENGEEKKGGKLLVFIIILLILALWFGVFAILIKLDIGGLGSMLRSSLEEVPILNTLLPEIPEEQLAWQKNYPFKTMEEAIARIQQLEKELETEGQKEKTYQDQIADLKAEIERLKVFEDDVLNFEARVERFNKMVVFNPQAPPLEEYRKFYEEINPTTAEEIYQLVLEKLQYDQGIQQQVDILTAMKPSQAAAVIEESTADIGLIAEWILAMKKDQAAEILNKMDQLYAAKIFRKMADMNNEALQDIMDQMDYE